MCGIFAVSGKEENAGEVVLKGLKLLEYRGYDSWGVSVKKADQATEVKKNIGKISKVSCDFVAGTEAMGHSRWATHGGVTKKNAHPHKVGKVTIVHNGIFENYLEVKKEYPKHTCVSETDTEIIAVCINDLIEKGKKPLDAIRQTAKKITGRFAILVMIDGTEGIYGARRGSPLIIGRGKKETFIASDIPAFLEKTNTVNYLDDNEMVYIKNGEAIFYDLLNGKEIKKRNIAVQWSNTEAEKGDYPHFMIKEIFDQKDTITRAINHPDTEIKKFIKILQKANGAYFIACGTAHKVAMSAEYFFTEISGRKINVVPASEMKYFERFINKKTAMIAISQSGETADVLESLENGKKKGAKILSMTNVESSSIARISNAHLPINAGPEKAVASTKAATAQMALCLLLAYADAGKLNQGKQILNITAGSINDMLNPRYENLIRKIAKKIVNNKNLFIIGRGSLYAMALESAIKIQEVSYINAQGFAAGELKHGPIALIEKNTPCVVLGDDMETISNAIELKARGAKIIGIAPKKAEVFDEWIKVPDCQSGQAIATIIPVQILAYHLAVLRSLDPDMPRNLAKSVTVK